MDKTRQQIADAIRGWCHEVKGDGDKYFNLVGAIVFLEGDGAEIRRLKAEKEKLIEDNERLIAETEKWRNDWERNQRLWETAYGRIEDENAEQDKAILNALKEMGKIRQETKADTVRKMLSMMCEGRVSNDTVVIVANQVAKEMENVNV